MKRVEPEREKDQQRHLRQILSQLGSYKVDPTKFSSGEHLTQKYRIESSVFHYQSLMRCLETLVDGSHDAHKGAVAMGFASGEVSDSDARGVRREIMPLLKAARVFTINAEVWSVLTNRGRALVAEEISWIADLITPEIDGEEAQTIWEYSTESINKLLDPLPYPQKMPFESMYIACTPTVEIGGDALAHLGYPAYFCRDDSILSSFSGMLVNSEGHAWIVINHMYNERTERGRRAIDASLAGGPMAFLSRLHKFHSPTNGWKSEVTAWPFALVQLIHLFNEHKSVSMGRLKKPLIKVWETTGIPRKEHKIKRPPKWYEVRLSTVLRVEQEREGTPGSRRYQDYYSDRRGHERVLVRRCPKDAPSEVIRAFKSKWTANGWSVFDEPDQEIEDYFDFAGKKCGKQPSDEIWAVDVTWVKDHYVGNQDGDYVPGVRTLAPNIHLDL